ncbi:MAG: hypothetical protein ACREJ5_26880 [Geminicoccaceae bacterium]
MDSLEERIEYYVSYFKRVLENIANIAASEERATPVFRTILYFSCLEAWAGDAFPRQRNKERFVRFLHEISEWEHADRVSIPQLFDILSRTRIEKEIYMQKLSATYNYRILPESTLSDEDIEFRWDELPEARAISDDPKVDALVSEIGIASRACVELFQYSHLLWDYRNFVIHRFQFPGRATDVPGRRKDVPYYLPCGNTLELVLPVASLQKLCKHSLAKFDRWLRERKIDPYRDSELKTNWKGGG